MDSARSGPTPKDRSARDIKLYELEDDMVDRARRAVVRNVLASGVEDPRADLTRLLDMLGLLPR
jgi:hypothetical protein